MVINKMTWELKVDLFISKLIHLICRNDIVGYGMKCILN